MIFATTPRRIGEKLLLYLALAVFVPMWVVIPLYRDKETATLFGYKASPQNIYYNPPLRDELVVNHGGIGVLIQSWLCVLS